MDKKEELEKDKELNKDINNEEKEVSNEETIKTEAEEVENKEEELSETDKLKKTNKEIEDKLKRNLAEFDNFRKRTMKEKIESFDRGVMEGIEKILPIVDNFDRALNSSNEKETEFFKGIEMIRKQFITTLNELGVEEIKALDEEFNTDYHYAVSHEENEEYGENVVIEVLQTGYKYKEKVIRCAMVKVAN